MTAFGDYAQYYDLLYQDKDYQAEALYIDSLLRSRAPGARSILEFGCGTGAHAALLAEQNYTVSGIDVSGNMIARARERSTGLDPDLQNRLIFEQGDLRTYRAEQTFDAVIALFHVMSYQTTHADLQSAFKTASHHLAPGGVFIFDCWYGPAVLTDPPETRIKRYKNDTVELTRIAEPEIDPARNVVTVNYQMFVRKHRSEQAAEVREVHCMRYLFHTEVENYAAINGLDVIHSEEWLTGKAAAMDTWYVCFIGRKRTQADEA